MELAIAGFIGGVFFWPLLGILTLALVLALEVGESGFWSTVLFLVTIVLVWLFGIPLLKLVQEHPFSTVLLIAGYIIMGILWSFLRYWDYLHEAREKRSATNAPDLTPFLHKDRIIRWMAFWPWSAVFFFFNKLIYRLFSHLYRWLGGVYEAIFQRVFPEPSSASSPEETPRREDKHKGFRWL